MNDAMIDIDTKKSKIEKMTEQISHGKVPTGRLLAFSDSVLCAVSCCP